LGSNGSGGDDNDDDDDDDEITAASTTQLTDKKKKRKKSKKKKKKKTSGLTQSSPPRVPLHELFPSGNYPAGELLDHNAPSETTARARSLEARLDAARPLEDPTVLADYRKAAEVHRQVRRWAQETVRPGQKLTDIAVGIEDGVRALLANDGLEPGAHLRSGLAFPTGLSVNNCVAHYTPNPGREDIVLQHSDVVKIDFGVHVDGWIVDSAFTMSFDPMHDNLLAAVKDATNTGIKVWAKPSPRATEIASGLTAVDRRNRRPHP
jgi:methionyl aminopeptidase